MDALLLHRLHFAFTITYHYLFPQLTMGLALLIVVLKTVALVRHNERYNEAARFWAKIFAINFLIGVVTGIPMEFQFGTNWAQFSRSTGGVIGQPLAMGTLGLRFPRIPGFMDIRLLHHRHQRLDAAPDRLQHPSQRIIRGHQLL